MVNSLFLEMKRELQSRWRPNWQGPQFDRLRKGFDSTLNSAGTFIVKVHELRKAGKLSALGLRDEARGIAGADVVPMLHRAALAAEQVKAGAEKSRLSLAAPAVDRTDLAGAFLRAEMRAWLKGLPPGEQMHQLLRPNADQRLLLAATEGPAELAGLTSEMQLQVRDHVVSRQHSGELIALNELDEAVELTNSAIDIALRQVRLEAAFGDDENVAFDQWMKAATAGIKEESREADAVQPIPPDEFSSNIESAIDEIWAKAFPRFYPDHPTNRVG